MLIAPRTVTSRSGNSALAISDAEYTDAPDSFTLVGCTVAPGFDFADFELGRREKMLAGFPQHADLLKRLTAEDGSLTGHR